MSLMRLSPNPSSPEPLQIHLFVRQRIPFQILFYLRQQGLLTSYLSSVVLDAFSNRVFPVADLRRHGFPATIDLPRYSGCGCIRAHPWL